MLLHDIKKSPSESLVYLDRYVNDGSPSGFTEINRTSKDTDPFGTNKSFNLYTIESDEKDFSIFGTVKQNIPLDENKFFIHPDMLNHKNVIDRRTNIENSFLVSPTSSCRTVKIINNTCEDFIKLHYDGTIGRINRKLNTFRAISGVEISQIVTQALLSNTLTSKLSIYEEPFCKIFHNPQIEDKSEHWGLVWRSITPTGYNSEKIKYTIPLFSLWSKDRNSLEKHESIAHQLFEQWGQKSTEYFLEKILIQILDIYFELIVKLGLQNEYNSQNILIGFDDNWMPISIILRDMMGLEKDLNIRKSLGLSTDFISSPYKIIQDSDNLYPIRHSFSFDFKVCTYVIEPLMNLATNLNILKRSELIEILRDRTKFWLSLLPKGYLPLNKWYSHERVLLTGKREYIEHLTPLLRD